MGKIKTHITKQLQFNIDIVAEDVVAFLDASGIPGNAKVRFAEPKSYPGEQGVTPGYIEVSWDE